MRENLPLWRQVELSIKEEIASGELKPGDELAPAASLAANYGVNLHTVRRALKELHEAGVVNVQNGRRASVQGGLLNWSIGPHTRFTENVSSQGREGRSYRVRSAALPAPSRVRKLLDLEPRSQVALLCIRGEADGVPVTYARNYLPLALFADAIEANERLGSIPRLIAEKGFGDIRRASTRIITRLPTEEEATQLAQPRNEPVIVTEYIEVDGTGRRLRYSQTTFPGARVQLIVGESGIFEDVEESGL